MNLGKNTKIGIRRKAPAPSPKPASTPLRHSGGTTQRPSPQRPAPARTSPARAAAAREQSTASAPGARPRSQPGAVASAARQYTGAFSGALNNLSEQEQRVADVANRRRADTERYSAYVMGQQGTIAAAAAQADQQALKNVQSVQGAAHANIQSLQTQQAAQNEAQGVGAPTAQMRAGLVDDANRTQMMLGAAGTRQATVGNANVGRAQFLQAAALANMNAHKRAISGEEFEQQSAIGREKTGVLTMKTQESLASKRAQQAAAAEIESARIDADTDAENRASRERIAGANISSRERLTEAQIANSALQGRANRRLRRKEAAAGGKGGGISPSEQRQRGDSARGLIDAAAQATGRARDLARSREAVDKNTGLVIEGERRPGKTPTQVRARLYEDYPGISAAAVEAAIDAAFPTYGTPAQRKKRRARFEQELRRRKSGQ